MNYRKQEEDDKMFTYYSKNTVKCKNCGHSVVFFGNDRVICNWCGNFVYKNAKIEFEYKLKQKLKEGK